MTTRDDLVDKATAWDAVSAKNAELRTALEAKDAEIARLSKCYDLAIKSRLEWREQAERLERQCAVLARLLSRYRKETPLGHQPHMIAHEVDAALEQSKEK